MGIQGVAVGTPDGNWLPVAVGPYEPTDFSLKGRLLVLLGELEIQLGLLALGAAFTAIALAVSNRSRPSIWRVLVLSVPSPVCLIVGYILLILSGSLGFFVPDPLGFLYSVGADYPCTAISWAIFLIPFFIFLVAIVRFRGEGLSRGAFNDFSIALAALSAVLAGYAIYIVTPVSHPHYIRPAVIAALVMAPVAIALAVPRWRELPVIALVMVGLYLLANLGFLFGIPFNGFGAGKSFAVALVSLAAFFYAWRLRQSHSSDVS